jgi:hypothetical protein
MDVLAQLYGEIDFSPVAASMVENPGYAGNPNIVFIPLSLGNVCLNRFEWRNHTADLETSIGWFGSYVWHFPPAPGDLPAADESGR